jgi:hypothetical protein
MPFVAGIEVEDDGTAAEIREPHDLTVSDVSAKSGALSPSESIAPSLARCGRYAPAGG